MTKKKCTNGFEKFCFWTAKNVIPLTIAGFVFAGGMISASVYNAYEAGKTSGKVEIMSKQIASLQTSMENVRDLLINKRNEDFNHKAYSLAQKGIKNENITDDYLRGSSGGVQN